MFLVEFGLVMDTRIRGNFVTQINSFVLKYSGLTKDTKRRLSLRTRWRTNLVLSIHVFRLFYRLELLKPVLPLL